MRFRKILVPLDGSALAEAAMWKAVDLGGEVDVVYSLLRAAEAHTFPGADPIEGQVSAVREAEEYLEGVAKRLKERGVQHVETHVWYGTPSGAITEAANAQKADMIVMSSHGRSGLGRLILGSVTESVLRSTTTPTLVVRAEGAPVEAPKSARPMKEASRV